MGRRSFLSFMIPSRQWKAEARSSFSCPWSTSGAQRVSGVSEGSPLEGAIRCWCRPCYGGRGLPTVTEAELRLESSSNRQLQEWVKGAFSFRRPTGGRGMVPGNRQCSGRAGGHRQLPDAMAAFLGTGTGLRSYIYEHNPEKPESHGCRGEHSLLTFFSSFIAGASLYTLLIKKI